MSARKYIPSNTNAQRTKTVNKPFLQRDEQCFLSLNSADLKLQKILRPFLPPLGNESSTPCIVLIGDVGNLNDEAYANLREFYLNGILPAASQSDAYIVDNGLATSLAVGEQTNKQSTDYCRNLYHIGVSPSATEEKSRFHTHQIVLSDFKNWDARPSKFAKKKFDFIRRLAGSSRIVSILINEGPSAFEEVLESCRVGIPVISLTNSGPLADEITRAIGAEFVHKLHPQLQEMVDSKCLYGFDIEPGQSRNCDLVTLIRCHLLTDIVVMTRLLSYTGPDGHHKMHHFKEPDKVKFEQGNISTSLTTRRGDGNLYRYDEDPRTGKFRIKERKTQQKRNGSKENTAGQVIRIRNSAKKAAKEAVDEDPFIEHEAVVHEAFDAAIKEGATKQTANKIAEEVAEEVEKAKKEEMEEMKEKNKQREAKRSKEKQALEEEEENQRQQQKKKEREQAMKEEEAEEAEKNKNAAAQPTAEEKKLPSGRFKNMSDEERAAIQIEAVARGNRDRAMVKKLREEKQAAAQKEAGDKDKDGSEPKKVGLLGSLKTKAEGATKEMTDEEKAALKIEAVARGNRDRAMVKKMKEEKEAKEKESKLKAEETKESGSEIKNEDGGKDKDTNKETKAEGGTKETTDEEKAALKIEAVARGNRDRAMVKKMKEEKEAKEKEAKAKETSEKNPET